MDVVAQPNNGGGAEDERPTLVYTVSKVLPGAASSGSIAVAHALKLGDPHDAQRALAGAKAAAAAAKATYATEGSGGGLPKAPALDVDLASRTEYFSTFYLGKNAVRRQNKMVPVVKAVLQVRVQQSWSSAQARWCRSSLYGEALRLANSKMHPTPALMSRIFPLGHVAARFRAPWPSGEAPG